MWSTRKRGGASGGPGSFCAWRGISARGGMAKRGVAANRARGHFCVGGHFAPRGGGVLRGFFFCSKGNSAVTLRRVAFSMVMFCAGGHFPPGNFRGNFKWTPTLAGTFTVDYWLFPGTNSYQIAGGAGRALAAAGARLTRYRKCGFPTFGTVPAKNRAHDC